MQAIVVSVSCCFIKSFWPCSYFCLLEPVRMKCGKNRETRKFKINLEHLIQNPAKTKWTTFNGQWIWKCYHKWIILKYKLKYHWFVSWLNIQLQHVHLKAGWQKCKEDCSMVKLSLHLVRTQRYEVVRYGPPFAVFQIRKKRQRKAKQGLSSFMHTRNITNHSNIIKLWESQYCTFHSSSYFLATCIKKKLKKKHFYCSLWLLSLTHVSANTHTHTCTHAQQKYWTIYTYLLLQHKNTESYRPGS